MLVTLILLTVTGYAAAILFLRRGVYNVDKDNQSLRGGGSLPLPEPNGATPSFSVIIAARNEEHNIAACLQTVFAQNISNNQYEVIVIDDRSNDTTLSILRELSNHHPNLKVITITEIPAGISPKKHAVSTGIKSAANDIIVFTDADCRVQPQWLSTIGKYFNNDDNIALVQGIASYSRPPGMSKIFWGLQSIDFLSHVITAAAAIGADLPINSSANNMAFRKSVFEEIGGYGDDGTVSFGDDDLILQRIWKHKKASHADGPRTRKIRFMADPCASVETAPTETVRAVFEQRSRWGSATVHYGPFQIALLSIIFAFYLTIPLTAIASIFDMSFLSICASLILIKLCGECVLMIPGTRICGKENLRKYIIPASLIQLPIVLAAVLFGVFGKLKWKGQVLSHQVKTS
ncbi:MAG: glycosyltransferase [Chitinispirillales bacterium]|nr:glycosyltransferase [Chitinispirillales bacterium]